MSFFDTHEDGCKPLQPCRNCQAVAFLQNRLNPSGFAEFLTLIGLENPGPVIAPAALDAKLEDLAPFQQIRPNLYKLINCNIRTVEDLARNTLTTLCRVPGLGKISREKVMRAFEAVGHQLGELPFEPQAVASRA